MNSRLRLALAAPAAIVLLMAPGCKKSKPEEKEIQELAKKAGELDKLSQQANQQGQGQTQKLQQAGVDVRPNPETMQLTEDQKKALEERIKAEKNSSYQALLQEVLDKDKEIKELNEKISKLRASLPKPDLAKANDSHYGMALRFLRKKGVSEAEAKSLVSRVNLMEKLSPGFEVYHFYSNGVYGTWVAQGKSKVSPQELQKAEREKVEGERDTALAQGEKLQEEVNDLVSEKQRITEEIEGLRSERANLIEERSKLEANNAAQLSKLNSLHYLVGNRDKLKADGIIEIPVFAKDRAGKNWKNEVFTQSLDLRSSDSITLKASELGLKKIGKINVVPGSYTKDIHYSLTISEDKQTATIKLIEKSRFTNDKVVFAVSE